MLRLVRLLAMLLVLIIVALASALISMRFAIHGREVVVPELRGMTPAEAERTAYERGLELSLGDRFYSATVSAGRIVSQQPDPGTRVRRGWRMRAAESLGPQLIEIPSVVGFSPRAAEIDLRRRGLEPGDAAELPIGGFPAETVLAQTPAARAKDIAAPRVSLLYAVPPPEVAYAVPDLTGLTLSEATSLIDAAGMKSAVLPAEGDKPGLVTGTNPAISGQEPPAGSRVAAGATITLQLASPS